VRAPPPPRAAKAAPERRLRADARRSEEALLDAAKAVFAEAGVDAPVRDIAARAGVGMGTLYRRFPKRSDLVAAVFRREVDACAAEAEALRARHPPGEALRRWLIRYAGFIAAKRGLAAALHSGDPAFDALPGYFRRRFEPVLAALLDAAASAGEIGAGAAPHDLLRAVGNLSVAGEADGAAHLRRMIDLIVDGLRFRAGREGGAPRAR
jgi:AcrR family transcriptional regulator